MSLHMELARFEWTSWSKSGAPVYMFPKGVWLKWLLVSDHAAMWLDIKINGVWEMWWNTASNVWEAKDNVSDGSDLKVMGAGTFKAYGLVKKS